MARGESGTVVSTRLLRASSQRVFCSKAKGATAAFFFLTNVRSCCHTYLGYCSPAVSLKTQGNKNKHFRIENYRPTPGTGKRIEARGNTRTWACTHTIPVSSLRSPSSNVQHELLTVTLGNILRQKKETKGKLLLAKNNHDCLRPTRQRKKPIPRRSDIVRIHSPSSARGTELDRGNEGLGEEGDTVASSAGEPLLPLFAAPGSLLSSSSSPVASLPPATPTFSDSGSAASSSRPLSSFPYAEPRPACAATPTALLRLA